MDKQDQIKKEIKKLNNILKGLSTNEKKLVEGLIQNAAFMAVTLKELQQEINEKGAVIECQSGNGFDTIKDNPAQKAYTTMISRYSGIIDQLMKRLPSESTNNDLIDFIEE